MVAMFGITFADPELVFNMCFNFLFAALLNVQISALCTTVCGLLGKLKPIYTSTPTVYVSRTLPLHLKCFLTHMHIVWSHLSCSHFAGFGWSLPHPCYFCYSRTHTPTVCWSPSHPLAIYFKPRCFDISAGEPRNGGNDRHRLRRSRTRLHCVLQCLVYGSRAPSSSYSASHKCVSYARSIR